MMNIPSYWEANCIFSVNSIGMYMAVKYCNTFAIRFDVVDSEHCVLTSADCIQSIVVVQFTEFWWVATTSVSLELLYLHFEMLRFGHTTRTCQFIFKDTEDLYRWFFFLLLESITVRFWPMLTNSTWNLHVQKRRAYRKQKHWLKNEAERKEKNYQKKCRRDWKKREWSEERILGLSMPAACACSYIWAIPALLTLHFFSFSTFIRPQ